MQRTNCGSQLTCSMIFLPGPDPLCASVRSGILKIRLGIQAARPRSGPAALACSGRPGEVALSTGRQLQVPRPVNYFAPGQFCCVPRPPSGAPDALFSAFIFVPAPPGCSPALRPICCRIYDRSRLVCSQDPYVFGHLRRRSPPLSSLAHLNPTHSRVCQPQHE